MLPRADLNGTRPVGYVEAPSPVNASNDARQEVYHRLNQIALGQQVPAKVLERLADGSYLVRLANSSARMSLPNGTQVGDELEMTLIERAPRPTFLLGAEAGRAGDAPATLSSAARLIDRLLQAAEQSGASTVVNGRMPLLPAAGADAARLAAAMQNALDGSGLFYESHLAQWTAGARALEGLLREPQAQQGGGADKAGQADAALLRHLVRQWNDSGRPMTELGAELQQRTGALLQGGALTGLLQGGQEVNPALAQLINAQLHALETQRIVWQGELWPGQQMAWEVERDDDRDNSRQEDASPPAWQSEIRLDLPALGNISASIRLTGDRVSIHVRAGEADSAALLRAHGGELLQALEAAGLPLDILTVNDGEQDGQT